MPPLAGRPLGAPPAAVPRPLGPALQALERGRAAVDAGLFLGRSFRACWSPGGALVAPVNAAAHSAGARRPGSGLTC